MRLITLLLILFYPQLGSSVSPEEIRLINQKIGGIAYQPTQEVQLRAVFEGGALEAVGAKQGFAVLEINEQVIYGIDDFYRLIATTVGETSLLFETKEGQLVPALVELGPKIPIGGGNIPASLEGTWTSGYESKFQLYDRKGNCAEGDKGETYSYASHYPNNIKSYGFIQHRCATGSLRIVSKATGKEFYGQLKGNRYMIWHQVPLLGRAYDFHIWR